jgi:hypothetical protein
VAIQTACSSTTPGAAASVAGRSPSRALRPAAHTAAMPSQRARSTTAGPVRPISSRSQVTFAGFAFEP